MERACPCDHSTRFDRAASRKDVPQARNQGAEGSIGAISLMPRSGPSGLARIVRARMKMAAISASHAGKGEGVGVPTRWPA